MIFFIVSLFTFFAYLILKTRNALIFVNKNGISKYKKWMIKKDKFLTVELLGIIVIILGFMTDSKITGISALILYTFLSLVEIKKLDGKFKFKKDNLFVIISMVIFYVLILCLIGFDYFNSISDLLIVDHSSYFYLIMIILGYVHYLIIYILFIIGNLFKNKKGGKKHNLK